jgi:hypothetical protein
MKNSTSDPFHSSLDFLHELFSAPLASKFGVNGSQSPPELGDLGGLPSIRAGGLFMATALLSAVLNIYSFSLPLKAALSQPSSTLKNTSASPLAQIQFRQPDLQEDSAPQDRPGGGGARPVCSDSSASICTSLGLMALVPFPETEQAWGQTLQAAPTLWFYIPYPSTAIHRLEFELWDEENQLIAQDQQIPIPTTPGVIRYQIPDTVSLEVGKTYRWYFLLRLDPDNPSLDEQTNGRIERIAPSSELLNQLETSSLLEQAQYLAAAGIWYDTLTVLAELYPDRPEAWRNFLQTTGLDHIAEEPLIQ